MSRIKLAFPRVGLALAAGLVLAECGLTVRGFMNTFGAGGIALELGESFLIYAIPAMALDLLAQALAPAPWKRSLLVRGLPIMVLAFLAVHSCAMVSTLAYAIVPVAALWALSTRSRWTILLAVATAFWSLRPAWPSRPLSRTRPAAAVPSGPSVVVVVLDTVRRDHCSTYGYARETTANLTALAARGVRFDRAYTSSCWSIPTHASLFTGLLSSQHGADMETFRLGRSQATLATLLAARGYETAGFSANPYIASGTGFSQGFSHFEEDWRPPTLGRLLVAKQLWRRLRGSEVDKGGAAVVTGVKRWFEARDKNRPYFLFVNFMEAHAPYQDVPRRFQRAWLDPKLSAREIEKLGAFTHEAQWTGARVAQADLPGSLDLLDGATAAADSYLGQVLATVGEDVIVVALSDHGELVGEHSFFGHMTGLYEPLLRVPMVLAGPGVPRGQAVSALVSIMDLYPTLAQLAGAQPPPSTGIDLLPILLGTAPAPEARLIRAEHFRTLQATQDWYLHRSAEELRSIRSRRGATVGEGVKRVVAENGEDLGYDLTADAAEDKPFAGALTGLPAAVPSFAGAPVAPPEMDPAQIEALKALGYNH